MEFTALWNVISVIQNTSVTMLLLGAMCSQRAHGCLTYHTEPLDYIWLFRKNYLHVNLVDFAEVSKHRC